MIMRILTANNTVQNVTNAVKSVEAEEKVSMPWYSLVAVIVLVLLSAYCNGTNIGVMGFDV